VNKFIRFSFILILMVSLFVPSFQVEAKTVRDLKNELQKLLDENNNLNQQIKYTESQINSARSNITRLKAEIEKIQNEYAQTEKEITALNVKISEKDIEAKNLVSFLQMTNSNNFYYEYIAGAESMTDFIYRLTVTDQLLEHNKKVTVEMNDMISQNNLKKQQLTTAEKTSKSKVSELNSNLAVLGSKKSDLYEFNMSVEEEIKESQKILKMYTDAGCKDNDDISTCARLPLDTSFWRPMETGWVSSYYGWRFHPIYKENRFHDGIDLVGNRQIYSVAAGKVAAIGYNHSTMGNYIYIHHLVNNKYYTSVYLHLKSGSINVRVGDVVSKNTVLATMGSTGASTGTHLHLSIATGRRGIDYTTYSTFVSRTVDPKTLINFPSGTGSSNSWLSRTRKY